MARFSVYRPDLPITVRSLVDGQMDLIDITTPESGGRELEVVHGLGRIPRGVLLVNRPYTGLGPWDWGSSGTTWTATKLYLKFSETSVNMTIAVF